jgi:hypothetical protein
LTVHGIGEFDDEVKKAVKIRMGTFTINVLPIERVIASKTFLNREKDRMVMPALKSAARALSK